ncbi:MAG: hypothetical protein AAF702_08545 [Chloroflexota bacterium]
MAQTGIYNRLFSFLLPLAITLVVVEIGIQVLNAGMARVENATETLAAYGVAWGLLLLFTSPLMHVKALSLVMANGPYARKKIERFVLGFSLLLTLGVAALTLTPISPWVIEGVHAISPELGETVRFALLCLVPAPLLTGMAKYYTGQLLRAKQTVLISLSSVASISAGIVLVFLLLPTPWIQARPIWLPILATYVNLAVDLLILFWGNSRLAHSQDGIRTKPYLLTEQTNLPISESSRRGLEPENPSPEKEVPTYGAIIQFIWPLSMNIAFQEFSRPLINIFLARGENGVEALAVITIAYALGQFPYRWLNDIRNLATAFQDEPDRLYHIRRFTIGCGIVSLFMMLGLFWTPLVEVILQRLMGLSVDFASLVRTPLMIFALFSPIVTLRAYSQGIVLLEKRTHIVAYCAPTRLIAVWLTLVVLPFAGVKGATLGVSALAAGFFIEALTIWWGVRGYQWLRSKRWPASTPVPS